MLKNLKDKLLSKGPITELKVCDKVNCKVYGEWRLQERDLLVKDVRTNCMLCKHFKGLDLYRPADE